MPCMSLYKLTCSGGKCEECPTCRYHYCKYHLNINNNLFGSGGHVCSKYI